MNKTHSASKHPGKRKRPNNDQLAVDFIALDAKFGLKAMNFLLKMPDSITISAFSLNLLMSGFFSNVIEWIGADKPFVFRIISWDHFCHLWSLIQRHKTIVNKENVARAIRYQYEQNRMSKRNGIGVFAFGQIKESWDRIFGTELDQVWIPLVFKADIIEDANVMYGDTIVRAREIFEYRRFVLSLKMLLD